jgi:hypothetical protein
MKQIRVYRLQIGSSDVNNDAGKPRNHVRSYKESQLDSSYPWLGNDGGSCELSGSGI